MPLDQLRQALHLRQQHNQQVADNLERLKGLMLSAENKQDLLDALHPWGAPNSLVFHNLIAIFLYICAAISLLTFLFIDSVSGHLLILLTSAALFGLGWLMYEPSSLVKQHVTALEHKMLSLSYQLHRHQLPTALSRQMTPVQFIRHIVSAFPVLQQGNYRNSISEFASIPLQWGEQALSAVVFRYDYEDHVERYNAQTKKYETKIIERHCWGILCLEQPTRGLIVSQSAMKKLAMPYHVEWKPTDIALNRNLNFYGASEMHLAKQLSPSLSLKLVEFFSHCQGSLNFHHELKMCCYLTTNNLFQVANHQKNIEDISMLRGHLRTLRLAHLDHALKHLEQLLQ